MKKRRQLPVPAGLTELWLRRRPIHKVWHRVLDRRDPPYTRWLVQRALQAACRKGFGGLLDFTDEAAVAQEWHLFEIKGRAKVAMFLLATAQLLRRGLIEVEVDGRKVGALARPALPRSSQRRLPVIGQGAVAKRLTRRVGS
ncbi:MAG TPA: hypothetical protein VF631_03980 [Allosphingosinicella sp.]|jgi:hypothetical protein|uniref:hypothetical protein n=1 Tax=Allosphingosinicella sp. TaxID=2823234 RepID=UPI002F2A4AD3